MLETLGRARDMGRMMGGGMALLAALALVLHACDSAPGATGDAGAECTTDLQCADGVFCNGTERCVAGTDGARCVAGTPPCLSAQQCDEVAARCTTACAVTRDADGDQVDAIECGGTDCDDSDPTRFPGNEEVCDEDGHDEDCDPATVGDRDDDEDGFIDALCCNGDRCGNDCDDSNASIQPGQAEVCNGVDDNCNGLVDEGVTRLFFPDVDGDGYGARTGEPTAGCSLTAGFAENALDCDDARADVAPGRSEICDGSTDEDCDGTVDEMLAVAIDCQYRFGSPPRTAYACSAEGVCEVGYCSIDHGDCDLEPSNGCETDLRNDPLHCGTCGRSCGVGGRCREGVCDAPVDVEAGAMHTCARRAWADGTPTSVVCWGANDHGQLGDGTTFDSATPVVVQGLPPAVELALSPYGWFNSSPYTCALAGGLVYCWGSNEEGRLGRGTVGGIGVTPAPVGGTPGSSAYYDTPERGTLVGMLSVGDGHACVVERQAVPAPSGWGDPIEVRCWGSNRDLQIYSGSTAPATTARRVLGTNPWRPFEETLASHSASCGVLRDSDTVSTIACRGAAAETVLPPVAEMAATSFFTIVLLRDGTLRYLSNPSTPVTAGVGGPVISGVAQISGGENVYCVRFHSGGVSCGPGFNGILTPVEGIDDAIDMSTGGTGFGQHACVIRASGGVWCWGANGRGQSGVPGGGGVMTPTRVTGL